jgi:hypothetical protein
MESAVENEFSVSKFIGFGVLFFVVILGLGWVAQGNEFFMYRYFAPKQEAVRRQVFEQSKAYNQGMVQELQNMQFQYVQADEAHKAALADIILHRASDFDFDDSRVPSDLKSFVDGLRRERTMAR